MGRNKERPRRTVARLTLDEQAELREQKKGKQRRAPTPVPAQMSHATSGKARKRARQGERTMERDRQQQLAGHEEEWGAHDRA